MSEKIDIKQENNKIVIECQKANKNEKKVANTIAAHIKNMVEGVTKGFEYKLQICSTHFPMTVNIEKGFFLIKNFLGESKNRIVKLHGDVDVSVKEDIITVKGINIENVAQCAANIERATRITNKDRRVFEDGIFITSKAGEKV
jgi:large subunit ribosomal protein L6